MNFSNILAITLSISLGLGMTVTNLYASSSSSSSSKKEEKDYLFVEPKNGLKITHHHLGTLSYTGSCAPNLRKKDKITKEIDKTFQTRCSEMDTEMDKPLRSIIVDYAMSPHIYVYDLQSRDDGKNVRGHIVIFDPFRKKSVQRIPVGIRPCAAVFNDLNDSQLKLAGCYLDWKSRSI